MAKQKKVKNYSALEVAHLCGVVNQTAINWIKKKYLKAFSTPGGQYRVYGEDLASFMDSRGMRLPQELSLYSRKGQKSLLLINDDESFSGSIIDEIKSEYRHCIVDLAKNGFDAGCKLAGSARDIVLLNCDMSGVDAEDVCRFIRDNQGDNRVSVIAFSSSIVESDRQLLLDAGADAFLGKPFDAGQISIYLE